MHGRTGVGINKDATPAYFREPLIVEQRVRTLAYQGSPELRAPDCGLLGSTWEASAPCPQVSAIAARATMPDMVERPISPFSMAISPSVVA
jgi:hypothetical protein